LPGSGIRGSLCRVRGLGLDSDTESKGSGDEESSDGDEMPDVDDHDTF